MSEFPLISIVIPAHNSGPTLGACLGAALASPYPRREVIVVDDCSDDSTSEIIAAHPEVRGIRLSEHGGASRARNKGAAEATGEVLFFIDSDCILLPDTLKLVAEAYAASPTAITGGTYTPLPPRGDRNFYSTFQSIFIHHNETKTTSPDYIATHAMVIGRETFMRSGGFIEQKDFMPILEDVEYSHRMREAGVSLVMRGDIQVEHAFDFTLWRSMRNAFKKARHWTVYSRARGDMLSDSGTASRGLKVMGACMALAVGLFVMGLWQKSILLLLLPPLPMMLALGMNAGIIEAFFRHGGPVFAMRAVPYYCTLYPLAAMAGGIAGMFSSTARPHA